MYLRIIMAIVMSLVCVLATPAAEYDPLSVGPSFEAEAMEWTVRDASRDRDVPLKIYLPASRAAEPVVLFSHGLGGNRDGCSYLGHHWAARGYVAVFLQHPGSDDSVWREQAVQNRVAAMREAASARNYLLRVQDVVAVLDRLAEWNAAADHALAGRLDLFRVGMSGHSFGAQTTQAVSGQSTGIARLRLADRRIKAAIAFSPSSPLRGDVARAFETVRIPWLLMTGTHDTALIGGQTVQSRLAVFPALPPGDKYELVLDGAEHSAFTDRRLPGDTQPRNPNHHRAILALSTAFWDAYLRENAAAQTWLAGDGPREILQTKDRWQTK